MSAAKIVLLTKGMNPAVRCEIAAALDEMRRELDAAIARAEEAEARVRELETALTDAKSKNTAREAMLRRRGISPVTGMQMNSTVPTPRDIDIINGPRISGDYGEPSGNPGQLAEASRWIDSARGSHGEERAEANTAALVHLLAYIDAVTRREP